MEGDLQGSAEAAYQDVIETHGDDSRGYLAKGVFYREIGKPDAAEGMFRQAKALVPGEMRDVVNAVIAQAKAQGALYISSGRKVSLLRSVHAAHLRRS